MSKWRLMSMAAAVLLALAPGRAQEPSIDVVLKRAAAYVAAFRQQLSGIIAEESYTQRIADTTRFNRTPSTPSRRLKSDLLLVKPIDADRYVELRDVYEVDGAPVRERAARLEPLLLSPSASAEAQLGAIIAASARYNIGGISRNINTPLMALQFLDTANQPRFKFKHVPKSGPVFGKEQDEAANEERVFRVSTEMWTIEYQEQGRNTIIRKPDGGRNPARGRFWINPEDGSVLISELICDAGGVIATVTVSYQTEPLMGFLVPIEMRESYVGKGERITGEASYGRFRQITKSPNH